MNGSDLERHICSDDKADIASALIVENDSATVRAILKEAALKGIIAAVASNVSEAVRLFEQSVFNYVFVGRQFCDPSSGSSLLNKIKAANPEMPVILLAEYDEGSGLADAVRDVVGLIGLGVTDVVVKPVGGTDLQRVFDTLSAGRTCGNDAALACENNIYSIVGRNAELLHTIELAKKTAVVPVAVLLSGESGTGKELFARLIHRYSKRSLHPFVAVNCAALNDSLLESELFGHEKGSFTGAVVQRKGRFEMADSGTLLLDEISETPISFQAKLLRVLEQQEFQRVGGNETIRVNVRLICTTNRDLLSLVREGKFRQDLYYRICGIKLVLPPLRERVDDMRDLVLHFVNMYSSQSNRRITRLDPAMMEYFCNFSWPGNIRQLRNIIRMLLLLGEGETLSLVNVPWLFEDAESSNAPAISGLGTTPLEQVEKCAIIETLRRNDNNQTQTAKILGISDRTLRDKIKKYKQQGVLQSV